MSYHPESWSQGTCSCPGKALPVLDWFKRCKRGSTLQKGDRHRSSIYHPVSLTSFVARFWNTQYTAATFSITKDGTYSVTVSVVSETAVLIETIDEVARHLPDGNQSDVILLGFEKNFDKIPHSRLLWIKAFPSNRKQHDVLEGAKSRHEGVLSGVTQGTVLCLLLFLTFIKNMLECFNSC